MIKRIVAGMAVLFACFFANAAEQNVTKSPDGKYEAFTRDGNLWLRAIDGGKETRLTKDGSEIVSNGYASWVYYEEIFGRHSRYKAFWWSPDSKKIAFYRFDNEKVPVFPIYSAAGQSGHLILTRYPKAGQRNPDVRVGVVDLFPEDGGDPSLVWADFEVGEQYFGTPFWGPDSRSFFVQREPRRQNQLGLYSVNALTGIKKLIYTEKYDTWVDFLDGIYFTKKGLYFARSFESGWEQVYFLSYDGKVFKRLTDGPNWGISIEKVDEAKGNVWFMARRDNPVHPALYRVDSKGVVTSLTNPDFYARNPQPAANGGSFTVELSTASTPWKTVVVEANNGYHAWEQLVYDSSEKLDRDSFRPAPELVKIQNDGFDLYGLINYPKDFDPSRKYPVIMTVYGGPGTAYVRDFWGSRDASNQWCYENGIIYMVVDPRSSGENGRRGMDQAFKQMTVIELEDYIAWAKHMQSKPFVKADKIGVTGFSFGGTTTCMLVLRYPEFFSCGIAGGGVYDWSLYDSVYTERFMDTPEQNPDGYARASVLTYVKPGIRANLRLTHGTGDDNVHFQNTLQLVDALQKSGIHFELMIYPDGMHGYRNEQRTHDQAEEADFWTRKLLD